MKIKQGKITIKPQHSNIRSTHKNVPDYEVPGEKESWNVGRTFCVCYKIAVINRDTFFCSLT